MEWPRRAIVQLVGVSPVPSDKRRRDKIDVFGGEASNSPSRAHATGGRKLFARAFFVECLSSLEKIIFVGTRVFTSKKKPSLLFYTPCVAFSLSHLSAATY
tara:strand:- start:37 stop:339 length:303 start_codon:yes stop_codon:yes gene_type:complete